MLAGHPVASSIRLAARPVGAASRQRRPLARASVSTARRVWVLPGPRATGQDRDRGGQRHAHPGLLLGGQLESMPVGQPAEGHRPIDTA